MMVGKRIDFLSRPFFLFFLLATSTSFNWFAEIRVALQNVGKGLKLVWIHFGKIDFEKLAVHNHLSLSGIHRKAFTAFL